MSDDRRDELLGAALGGDLTPGERAELDDILREDPTARADLAEAKAVVRALRTERLLRNAGDKTSGAWVEVEPPASLHERVLMATARNPVGVPRPRDRGSSGDNRRRRLLLAGGAVLLLGIGVVTGLGAAAWFDRPPQGPAGTLGAREPIIFTDVPDGVEVTASVVAHAWGTETVFDEISGLPDGQTYDVVLLADNGAEVPAGSFLSVAGSVDCRMTSATLREDVRAISIRTTAGTEVMGSTLPEVDDD